MSPSHLRISPDEKYPTAKVLKCFSKQGKFYPGVFLGEKIFYGAAKDKAQQDYSPTSFKIFSPSPMLYPSEKNVISPLPFTTGTTG